MLVTPGSRGLPWSTGINRDVQRRDSEILNMFKIARVHPGGRLYRALPCRHRVEAGIYSVYAGMYRISICHYTVSLPGCTVLAVDLVMDLVETTIFLPDIFYSFLLFVCLYGFSSMLMLQHSS